MRKNLEWIYLLAGFFAAIEALWVLHQLKKLEVTSEFIGPAPYLIFIGAAGLLICGFVAMVGFAARAPSSP